MRRGTGIPKYLVWKFDYSSAPCLGADQKARGLLGRDWCFRVFVCKLATLVILVMCVHHSFRVCV